ncbi:hypothetical protein D9M70_632150 [compost metagenome]
MGRRSQARSSPGGNAARSLATASQAGRDDIASVVQHPLATAQLRPSTSCVRARGGAEVSSVAGRSADDGLETMDVRVRRFVNRMQVRGRIVTACIRSLCASGPSFA